MGESTKISWTDATFNPWVGCQKVAPGCQFCYAEADMDQRRHFALWGPSGTRVKTSEANWGKPLKWNRDAAAVNTRRRVFCSSLADVFEDWAGAVSNTSGDVWTKPYLDSESQVKNWQTCDPETQHRDPQGWRLVTMNDLRAELFATIDATPNLDWQLLTKRPENILKMWPANYLADTEFQSYGRSNVWLGTSISDQATANKAIPELIKCRDLSPVLFLSIEPLLGPINITRLSDDGRFASPGIDGLDWVIVGGESGPNARPCNIEWIRDIVRQCQAAGVPCFVKQLGLNPSLNQFDGLPDWPDHVEYRDDLDATNVLKLKDKKGGDMTEWPASLRVREFPQVHIQ